MLIVYRNIFIFSLFNQQHSNPKMKRNCAFLQSRDLTADGRRNVCKYSSNVVVRIVRSNNFQRPNLFYIQYHMSLNLCGDSEVDMQNVHFIVSLTTVAMSHRKTISGWTFSCSCSIQEYDERDILCHTGERTERRLQ
jgi:hypothetical protein